MTRNVENRVEIAFPVYEQELKDRIKRILTISLRDNFKAREQDQYGRYSYVTKNPDEEAVDSQKTFFNMAYESTENGQYIGKKAGVGIAKIMSKIFR